MQIVTKLPNENIQTYQLQMIDSGGGGTKLPNENKLPNAKVNYQIMTKLPNENIQTYQLQMIDSGGGGTTKCKL